MYQIYIPQLDCEVTRHIDQLRAHPFPIHSENSQWDPDVVPDIPSSSSEAAALAATVEPATTSACAAPPAAGEQSSSQPEEGERLDVTARPVDPDPAQTGGPTTPTVDYVARRRHAISPQFATPSQVHSGYDTE
ncbi:uncharacterized protein LOC134668714 [Cydia fagiglandana]|uniref:uncharacterized protein LOC134668714 n=1 Tax=Cydia fagiglandana TaxID=1458189 RepID=UPI002FEE4725